MQPSAWTPSEKNLLEEGVIPSPNSVELERTTQSDYLHRMSSASAHVAELFHENSKLSPAMSLVVPRNTRKIDELREWFFSTAYAMRKEEVEPLHERELRIHQDDLPAHLRSFLEPFTVAGTVTDTLFSVDLLVLTGERLYRVVPRTQHLWVERTFFEEDFAKLRTAVPELAPAALVDPELVFLVGCPWRYMSVYGPRGYRHMLMDAGRLLAHMGQRATDERLSCEVTQNFYDHRVDGLLYADGVERSTLAVCNLKEQADD